MRRIWFLVVLALFAVPAHADFTPGGGTTGGGGGGHVRPSLVGDELLVWQCNDAASPLVNTGSAASSNATAFGTVDQYQAPGVFASGVRLNFSADGGGFQGALNQNVPNAFSVSAWINVEAAAGSDVLVSKDNSDTGAAVTHSSALLYLSVGTPSFLISSASNADFAISARSALPVNGWHFIVGTYTSGSMNLYVDGVLAATSTTPTGNITQYATSWNVGGRTGIAQSLAGEIAEVRVNSSALAATTIAAQWKAGMGYP